MSDAFELEICQGKYRYRYEAGKQEVWRNGYIWQTLNGKLIGDKFVFSLAVELDEALKECGELRAKIEAMEQQEPVATIHINSITGNPSVYFIPGHRYLHHNSSLYALPGAQPAPNFADAYQGAMEEVAIWKKRALEAEDLNRKFVAEINGPTYMGEPAQPAPSVPNGWKEAAIAWEVCASIHREYGKGKDPFFNTRQGDFVKHANDARAMLAASPKQEAQPAPSEQDASVRKAWARFSHELHRSPDAPYPGMADAFEQHFSQSFIDREWRAEATTWAAAWKAAKRHCGQIAPSVPDRWKLVPIEPTLNMLTAATLSSHAINAHRAEYCYRAMLAAAPEFKL